MNNLSQEAEAVLNAFSECTFCGSDADSEWAPALAAALRTVADCITPFVEVRPQDNLESRREAMVWGMSHQSQLDRSKLLNLAKELDGASF